MTAKITATTTATWSFGPTTMTVNGRTFGASYSVARGGDVYVFTGVQAAPGAQRIPVRMHITQDMPMHADALAAARLAAETETPKADPAPVEAPKAQAPAPVQDAPKAQAPAPVQDDAKAAKAPKAAKPKAKPAPVEAPKAQAPAPVQDAPKAQAPAPVQDDAKAAKAAKAPKAAKPKAKPALADAPKAQAPAPVQEAPKAQAPAPVQADAKPAKTPKAAKPKAKPAPVQEAPKAQAPAPTQDAAQAVCKPAADAAQAVCKAWIGSTITGKGWRIVFDGDAQRTRVIFDAKPTAAQAAAVDAARFYYSPSMGSYNKHLTCKAYKAAQALAQTLAGLAA